MNARILGLGAAALLLAACARGEKTGAERTPNESLTVAADTSHGYRTSAPAPVTPVQGGPMTGGPLAATGQFSPVGGGESPGSVAIAEKGAGTGISISLHGMAQGAVQAALVSGNCATGGAAETPIGELTVGASGTAGLNVPVRTVMDGTYSVRPSRQGTVLACAGVPRVAYAERNAESRVVTCDTSFA